jgi:hypothetical protein
MKKCSTAAVELEVDGPICERRKGEEEKGEKKRKRKEEHEGDSPKVGGAVIRRVPTDESTQMRFGL